MIYNLDDVWATLLVWHTTTKLNIDIYLKYQKYPKKLETPLCLQISVECLHRYVSNTILVSFLFFPFIKDKIAKLFHLLTALRNHNSQISVYRRRASN